MITSQPSSTAKDGIIIPSQSCSALKPSGGSYLCPVCNELISDTPFVTHVTERHEYVLCASCIVLFSSKEQFAVHSCSKETDKLRCTVCDVNFPSEADLRVHTSFTHSEMHFEIASQNSDPFPNGTLDPIHSMNSADETTLSSSVTEQVLNSHEKTKDSKSIKRNKGEHQCSFCSEKFASKSDLERHKLQHTGEKPFKCSICKTAFTRQSSLNKHCRIHTGLKPYSCEACSAAFSYRYQLNKHRSKACYMDKNFNV